MRSAAADSLSRAEPTQMARPSFAGKLGLAPPDPTACAGSANLSPNADVSTA
jgi:hypothetical protein